MLEDDAEMLGPGEQLEVCLRIDLRLRRTLFAVIGLHRKLNSLTEHPSAGGSRTNPGCSVMRGQYEPIPAGKTRDSALFHLAVPTQRRASDLVHLRVACATLGDADPTLASLLQVEAHEHLRSELTGQTKYTEPTSRGFSGPQRTCGTVVGPSAPRHGLPRLNRMDGWLSGGAYIRRELTRAATAGAASAPCSRCRASIPWATCSQWPRPRAASAEKTRASPPPAAAWSHQPW